MVMVMVDSCRVVSYTIVVEHTSYNQKYFKCEKSAVKMHPGSAEWSCSVDTVAFCFSPLRKTTRTPDLNHKMREHSLVTIGRFPALRICSRAFARNNPRRSERA